MVKSLARYHGALLVAGAACILVNWRGLGPLWFVGVALVVTSVLLLQLGTRAQRPPREERPPVAVDVPVQGSWKALNGPATKVPSHTHRLAQTYAIDLVGPGAPEPVWFWPPARRPEAYPAFGASLRAPADARVVAVHDGARDHFSRTSLPGLLYLVAEGFARSLGPPRHLLGNHLVLDLGGGVHAVFAHLRRRSLKVGVGDRVTAGQPLAECGNSGNSSEPHLHFQLMDGPDIGTAHGLRFTWHYRDADGRDQVGVPPDGTPFTPAGPPAADRPTIPQQLP